MEKGKDGKHFSFNQRISMPHKKPQTKKVLSEVLIFYLQKEYSIRDLILCFLIINHLIIKNINYIFTYLISLF